MPGLHVYVSALLIVAGLYAMAFPIFLRFRTRIAFWV
jgi:hypothetical protein